MAHTKGAAVFAYILPMRLLRGASCEVAILQFEDREITLADVDGLAQPDVGFDVGLMDASLVGFAERRL